MNAVPSSYRTRWSKLWRYAWLYGWRRTLVKAAGRTRSGKAWMLGLPGRKAEKNISVIGCGQAAFATLCYFLYRERGPVFLDAYDVDRKQADSLGRFYDFASVAESAEALLNNPALRTVYIASNHASHAGYAVAALERGLDVFVEKPIVTTWEDLRALEIAVGAAPTRIWAGYNRPFAPAIIYLREALDGYAEALALTCRVYGHAIPPDHWYRKADEGTRISGNAGHWLDLFVHLVAAVWGELPAAVDVALTPDNPAEPDDNFHLTVRTPTGDSLHLHFTSYTEPPLGVHESIVVECGGVQASIDDFKAMQLWLKRRCERVRYRPKDVGHRMCTLQPFLPQSGQRDWAEVVCSTRLMLHTTGLARSGGGSITVDLTRTAAPASFEPE